MVELLRMLFEEKKIRRISDIELWRYVNFYENSYRDNLEHSRENVERFPRWSIISGYYAMHDLAKLFLAKKFRIKVVKDIHKTTIEALRVLIKKERLVRLLKDGYDEFSLLTNELETGKEERVKAQYYTGTPYLKETYRKRAKAFLSIVEEFIKGMERLL